MVNIVEPLNEKAQNELLWKTLLRLAEKIQPHFKEKEKISIHSSLDDPLEFILTSPYYYIKAGKKKIFGVLLGFPGPMGFFGRKKSFERRISAFHDSPDNTIDLIKNALEEYATACYATEVILNKF